MKKLITASLFIFIAGISGGCTKKCEDHRNGNDCIDPSKATGQPCYTLRYDPVCGCNNVTYNSPCDAENAGVQRWVKGECENTTNK